MTGLGLDYQYNCAAGGDFFSVFLPVPGEKPQIDVHKVGAFVDPTLIPAGKAMEYFV